MTLEALRTPARTDEEIEAIYGEPLPRLVEDVVPPLYPSDPEYGITVYYDATRFPNDEAVRDLTARMEEQYAPRTVGVEPLNPKSLEYASLSPFPEFEKLFFERGFVADLEGRRFRQGQVADTRFAKRNLAALNGNAMAMATLLHGRGHNLLPPPTDDETRWQLVHRAMAPVLGKDTIYREDPLPDEVQIYPLVEHEQLLLGCTNFRMPRRVHWAYETTPALAIDKGAREHPRESLFEKSILRIKQQLLFEAAHTRTMFRTEFLYPGTAHTDVSQDMIIAWYSQAIAAIRKVCWLVSATQDASVVAQSLHEEKRVHRHVIGAGRLPDNARTWDNFIIDRTDQRNAEIAELCGPVTGHVDMTYDVDWRNEILAALMGATYNSIRDTVDSPYEEPYIFVRYLAYWIGSLKRKRTATLDLYTAEGILRVWTSERPDRLLLSQFPRATWKRLAELSRYIVNDEDAPDIEVSYTWTRDLAAPYKYRELEESIALEGPLLCFPVLEAADWQEKAQTLVELHGFKI